MSIEQISRYEVVSRIGKGGMGEVFLAYDPQLERQVAIKLLARELLAEQEQEFLARFRFEAVTVANLNHPCIVPIWDTGAHEGRPFIVMQYMANGSLLDRMKKGPPLTQPDIALIIWRVSKALDAVHSRGIVHRDLKPGNVMFDDRWEAYLSDFGLARKADSSTTQSGNALIGTPAYMSPEQARGVKELDGRTDIYALGVVLFQILTGQLPYRADDALGMAVAHVTEPVPDILEFKPDLPPGWGPVIRQAMAKDPAERFTTAVEMASAVRRLTGGMPMELPSPPPRKTPAAALYQPPDVEGFQRAHTLEGHTNEVLGVAFHPDWRTLASASSDRTVRLWNLADPGQPPQTLSGHENWVHAVAFSPDGQRLASASSDRTVRLWSIADPSQPARCLEAHAGPVYSLAFSADGRALASASHDASVRLWHLAEAGQPPHTFKEHTSAVLGVALSPDGRFLASASNDKTVRLWDVVTGQRLYILDKHTSVVRGVAFSPDGCLLASASGDRTVRLWDVLTGQLLKTFEQQSAEVRSVAFSPDGRLLASGSKERLVQLWDVKTGQLLCALAGHTGQVNAVAFSPDGQQLASGSFDKSVRVWGSE